MGARVHLGSGPIGAQGLFGPRVQWQPGLIRAQGQLAPGCPWAPEWNIVFVVENLMHLWLNLRSMPKVHSIP